MKVTIWKLTVLGVSLILLPGGTVRSHSHWINDIAPTKDFTLHTQDGLGFSLSSSGSITSMTIDELELVMARAPALRLRDLTRANEVEAQNLVSNPGFESGLSDWTPVINNGLTVDVVRAHAHAGGRALELSSDSDQTGFAAYASRLVSVEPGKRYRVGAFWRSQEGYLSTLSGTPPALQMDLYREPRRVSGLYLQWFDGNGQPLGDPQLAVALHMNAANWRFIQREVTASDAAGSVRVIVAAKLRSETLWVDDVRLIAGPEAETPITGMVEQEGPRLIQTATIDDLAFQVIYEAHGEFISIHGKIQSLVGEDRAFDLILSLPIAADDWRWWDDAHRSRVISAGIYENAISAIFDGWLPISLYPYAGVEDGTAGVALALPPDHPQLALVRYDAEAGKLEAVFHLGISPQASKLSGTGAFDLLLYRFDPAWGFRSVIAKHVALFPEAYNTDLPIYSYTGRAQGSFYTSRGAEAVKEYDEQGVYAAQYTVGELPVKVGLSSAARPTLEEILSAVDQMAQSPRRWDEEFAQAIDHSAAIDTNGDWILKHVGVFSWDLEHWEASWTANLDPDVDQGLARWLIRWRIDPAFAATEAIGAHLDGVQIDNFMSTPAIDLRSEALQNADHTLTYSPHSYQPGVHTGFAMFEYLQFLRGHLDETWGEDRGLTINFWGLGHPNYLAGFIDGLGGEGKTLDGQGTNWNPEILNYRRAVASHKPLLFANQTPELTPEAARRFRALALLYGIVPGQGPHGSDWSSETVQILEETAATVRRYWALGWEPVTYARADNSGLRLERFGHDANEGIFFTVYNSTETEAAGTLTIAGAVLGVDPSGALTVTEIISGEAVPFTLAGTEVHIPTRLEGHGVLIYRLSSSRVEDLP